LKVIITFYANQTTHKVDHQIGALLLQRTQGAQPSIGLILRALADNTGVENNHISLFCARSSLIFEALQSGGNALRIGNIHLTAFSPNVILHVQYYNKGLQIARSSPDYTEEYEMTGKMSQLTDALNKDVQTFAAPVKKFINL
jgi:hypothetical protein